MIASDNFNQEDDKLLIAFLVIISIIALAKMLNVLQ